MTQQSSSNAQTRATLESTLKAKEILNATLNDYDNEDTRLCLEIETLERSLKQAKNSRLRLKENIETITTSITQLDSVVSRLRGALSPVRGLPAEVLLRIFQLVAINSTLVLEDNLARWKCPAISGRDPVILSRVCSVWRAIMMTNASVWSPFLVRFGASGGPSEDYADRITRWAACCPPARQRLWLADWTAEGQERHNALMTSVSTSWKAIDVIYTKIAPGRWDIEKPRAQEVTIYRVKTVSIQYFIPLMRFATKLTIFGLPPEWETLPWIALKTLTLKPLAYPSSSRPLQFNCDAFIALLQAANQLNHLTLDFAIEERFPDGAEPRPISHSTLESISFHLEHFSTNGHLFGVQLNAPSLHRITLLSVDQQAVSANAPFHRMWESPTHLVLPRLEDFELVDTAELVRWYPHVDILEVNGPNIDTLFVFMHTLFHHIPPQSQPLPLPRLTTLVITNTDVRGDTLVELVENRLRHVQAQTPDIRPITSITMYDSPGVTPSHWSRVQELLEEGRRSLEMRTEDDMEG